MVIEQYLSKLSGSRRKQILETLKHYPPPPHFWKVVNLRWLRGFIQGDGTFNACFVRRKDCRKGIQIQHQFGITQHKISIYTLLAAKVLLGSGQIYFGNNGVCNFKICNKVDLNQVVMDFFQQGGFVGSTQFRCILLSQILQSNYDGEQPQQLKNFVEIINVALDGKSNHRRYSSDQLFSFMAQGINKVAIKNIEKQYQNNKLIPQYGSNLCEQYVSGFTDAEGCFMIQLKHRVTQWPLVQAYPRFSLCAAIQEEKILYTINKNFFQNLGKIYNQDNDKIVYLRFAKLDDILEVIIPFFLLNPVISSKYYDFEKFATVTYMKKADQHKTIAGMEKIIELAFQSNSGKYGKKSTRHHSKAWYLRFLSIAPNRQVWKEMKFAFPSLKQKIMVSRFKHKI